MTVLNTTLAHLEVAGVSRLSFLVGSGPARGIHGKCFLDSAGVLLESMM